YGDAEDDPTLQIEMKADASTRAEAYLSEHQDTRQRFDHVVSLITGFETPYGMELLATVHWVRQHDGSATVDDAIAKVYAWNDRKKMFPEQHICLAWDVLDREGSLAKNQA
ncbi:hypothetical protein LCGC14_2190230, partial [marine sediment metagenome]